MQEGNFFAYIAIAKIKKDTLIKWNILSPYKWVFVDEDKAMPAPSYKAMFDCLYIGGCGLIGPWEMGSCLMDFMG